MDDLEVLLRTAMHGRPFSTLAHNATLASKADAILVSMLSSFLQQGVEDVRRAFNKTSRNVRTILRRQIFNATLPTPDHPVCNFHEQEQLFNALRALPLKVALLTLARVYDEAHMTLCKSISAARKGKFHHGDFLRNPVIDLQVLAQEIEQRREAIHGRIVLEMTSDESTPLQAVSKPLSLMSFDCLERLPSLAGRLPGENVDGHGYAGIGGGGGSDVISASLLGRLLEVHNKKMDLLVSTRTWVTGSQGKEGSKLGVKREVYNHDGQAKAGGKPVSGTFRVKEGTYAEGRDLETIPLKHHRQIYMVLDQGDTTAEVPENDRAELKDQFDAVLAQAENPSTFVIVSTGGSAVAQAEKATMVGTVDTSETTLDNRHVDTVLSVDTGGDVFGKDGTGGTTPDQDFRVQKAISTLTSSRNLVTAVVAPGVDAPGDAPEKAKAAGGMVYRPTKEEEKILLDTLAEYRMDGSDPSRFGKTTLALQARLRGVLGWTSLDLPEHVVDTWENPWSSFVYIQECMSDIILMPTRSLLPLIQPTK